MDQELTCRTCFTKTTRCLSIFSEFKLWDKVISLYKMIMACAPIEISLTDGLPSKICENCLTKLQYSFLFRMQILQADIKLRNYARKTRVPHLNSVVGDFLPEPILKNSKSNIQEIYSLDQILQSSPLLNVNISVNDESFSKSFIKNELKTEPIKNEITEFIEEVMVISDEDVIPLKTDKQICSIESNKVQVADDQTQANETSDKLQKTSMNSTDETPLYGENISTCIKQSTTKELPLLIEHTVNEKANNLEALEIPNENLDLVNAINTKMKNITGEKDKLQKTSMYPTDERSLCGQNISTCSKQSTTKGLSFLVKHTVNEKTNNLEALEMPNENLDLVNAINMKMKNITGEKDDRSKTVAINAKSLKTGIESIHECNIEMKSSLKNQIIHTYSKKDTSKTESIAPSQVETIANSVYKYLTNSKILQNVPANNTVMAANRTKNKQKPDKNGVVSKDECTNDQNSHLSQKIILTDQMTPVTSSVRRNACKVSSDHKKNCRLSQKNSKNFMALMTVDDFISIGNETRTHSKIKLYKIPTSTLLQESTVVNCSKQANDVSVLDKSKPRNVKNQTTSINQDNILFNKRITHSNSTSSTLLQSCIKSSIEKNANNLTAINIKNRKQENSVINKTIDLPKNVQDFKRKVNHKVYVNKKKKYSTGQYKNSILENSNIFSDILQD